MQQVRFSFSKSSRLLCAAAIAVNAHLVRTLSQRRKRLTVCALSFSSGGKVRRDQLSRDERRERLFIR